MANELIIHYPTGATLYVLLHDATGQIWNGSAFAAPGSANWTDYDIAMTEVATETGIYRATMPGAAAGSYGFVVRLQAGANPAVTDLAVGYGTLAWSGTAEIVPASQASVDAVSAAIGAIGSGTGAALNFEVTEDNTSAPIKSQSAVGTQTGTYANTLADDGTTHQIASVTNAINWVYGFNVGAARAASKVVLRANMSTTGDTVTVYAYNFLTPGWDVRTTITGTAETLRDIPLLASHTGSGADEGKVYIRFVFAEADAGTLVIDEAYVQAQQSGSLIGYLDGLVWVDATAGTAGTTPYINGTADNPCTTIADAYAIAAAVGLTGLHIAAGTTLTLTQSAAKWRIAGNGRVALNGQSIADAVFEGLYTVSGTSSGDDAFFENCGIGDVTVEHAYFANCRMKGTLTMVAAQAYFFLNCYDANESAAVQAFTFAANASAMFRDWRGGLQLNSMAATNEAIIDGAGRVVIDASSTAGSITVRGFAPALTGAGAFTTAPNTGTITQDARYSIDAINAEADAALADINLDHLVGTATGIPALPAGTFLDARTLASAGYALEATLTAIKGGTWSTETLVALKTAVDAILLDTGTDGVKLHPTQGAVAFGGQVKITADADGEGALHIVNTHADAGVGLHAEGYEAGLQTDGDVYGQHNAGGTVGQYNNGANYGQYNNGPSLVGQYNASAGGYGQLNAGTGLVGQYNSGPTGQLNEGTSDYGTVWSGITAATNPAFGTGTGTALTEQQVADAVNNLAPAGGSGAAGSIRAQIEGILEDTGTTLPATLNALPAAIEQYLASYHGAGYWDGSQDVPNVYARTYYLPDNTGHPIGDCLVWVTTDVDGTNIVQKGITDDFGNVTIYLQAGTYYIWRRKAGMSFSNPDSLTVVAP